ncbi:hypothetical protein [Micromonospora sp. NPDC003776]
MTSTGRRITTLAVLAVAVAAMCVYFSTARSAKEIPAAAGARGPAMTAASMRSALLPEAQHPAGTTLQEMPLTKGDMNASQGGMIVAPESCLGALKVALGTDEVNGWIQRGSRKTSTGYAPFQNSVGQVKGGLDVAKLRAAVGTCKSGTITWPEKKLTATISLSEVTAPAIKGANTFTYMSTMSFTGVTKEQLKDVSQCAIEQQATISNASCVTYKATGGKTMDVALEVFVGYAAVGDTFVEACEATAQQANEMVALMFDRLEETNSAA